MSTSRKYQAHNFVCEYGKVGIHAGKVIAIHQRKKPPYNFSMKGPSNLYHIPWTRVICDESQRFANHKTYTFKTMIALYGDHKWCLTGTPIRNYDTDMWSQLRFCGYDSITISRLWRRRYFNDQNLKQYMYESTYQEAKVVLPEKKQHTHFVDMDPDQFQTYEALLIEIRNIYQQMLDKVVSYAEVLAMFTRLRQVCIAPYLIVQPSKRLEQSDNAAYKWIQDPDSTAGIDSPKVRKVVEIVSEIPKGEKILVFSMFVGCLDITIRALKTDYPEIGYALLDGSKTGRERIDIFTNFKDNPNITVLFVHYKIGGEGLNLVEANHVICIEPWWSPSVHDQGIARAWRRGQTKAVNVHFVVTKKTIEEQILKLCKAKEQLAEYYLHEQEYQPVSTGLTKHELRKLIM